MAEIKPWKILESHITFQDRYLKVRSDRCQTEHGQIISPYHVLEYEPWINAVMLTPDFQCVLIREYRHGNQTIQLGLPGGGLEAGESPLEAIKREVLEETGYQSNLWQPLGTFDVNPNKQSNQLHSFLAFNAQNTSAQKLDSTEAIEVLQMPFMDVIRALRQGQMIVHALYIVPLWTAVSYLLEGRQPELEPLRQDLIQDLRL